MQLDQARKLTDAALDNLKTALEQGRSDTLVSFLSAMAHFHAYSFGNIMLILHQRPEATQVAGFTTWRKLGRFVRKGEKGIAIIAPMRLKKRTETAEGEPETFVRFRVAHVFDVAQTDGEELPSISQVSGEPGEHLESLKMLVAERDIALNYVESLNGALGVSRMGSIDLLSGLEPAREFSVLVHELAHELLHTREDRTTLTKAVIELEAEAVAFVVGQAIGLAVRSASADYIQLHNGDAEALAASLGRIQHGAQVILTGMRPKAE